MAPNDDDKEKEGKKGGGKGRAGGSSGSGALGGTSGQNGIAFSVDAVRLKQIMADWRKLNMGEAVSAVAEFFNEGVARASANLIVTFETISATGAKAGFAIMNRFITFGQDMVGAMRTRSREATAQVRKKYGIAFRAKATNKVKPTPNPRVT